MELKINGPVKALVSNITHKKTTTGHHKIMGISLQFSGDRDKVKRLFGEDFAAKIFDGNFHEVKGKGDDESIFSCDFKELVPEHDPIRHVWEFDGHTKLASQPVITKVTPVDKKAEITITTRCDVLVQNSELAGAISMNYKDMVDTSFDSEQMELLDDAPIPLQTAGPFGQSQASAG